MQYNFKRTYSLTIGTPPSIRSIIGELDTTSLTSIYETLTDDIVPLDNLTIPAKAVEINTLQIEASISLSKDDQGSSQQTVITIYNLDKDTLDFISRKNSLVILKAGYSTDDDMPILFSGQVKSVKTTREGTDLVTRVHTSDGYTPATGIKISTSLIRRPPQTLLNYEDVFDHLASIWKDNGVSISKAHLIYGVSALPVIKTPRETLIPDGWSYEGKLRDAMDDLCEHFHYTWYIQNNILFVHPINSPKFTNVLNLASDQILDIQTITKAGSTSIETEETGFKVRTFLNGRLKMGNRLRILGGENKGDYNITSIMHSLNFRGNDWNTIIETEVIK